MKHLKTLAAVVTATLSHVGPPAAHASDAFNVNEVSQVAPSFVHYSHDVLRKLWERAELSPRDRSLVTLAALIARAQTIELPYYVGQALDNGVNPGEISEIITHLLCEPCERPFSRSRGAPGVRRAQGRCGPTARR